MKRLVLTILLLAPTVAAADVKELTLPPSDVFAALQRAQLDRHEGAHLQGWGKREAVHRANQGAP
jgi:hypothetical protein